MPGTAAAGVTVRCHPHPRQSEAGGEASGAGPDGHGGVAPRTTIASTCSAAAWDRPLHRDGSGSLRWARSSASAAPQTLRLGELDPDGPKLRRQGTPRPHHPPGLAPRALVEASQKTALGGGPLRESFERIARRHGRNVAKVAVARKIAKVVVARRLLTLSFYGLRDGEIRCLAAAARDCVARRARVESWPSEGDAAASEIESRAPHARTRWRSVSAPTEVGGGEGTLARTARGLPARAHRAPPVLAHGAKGPGGAQHVAALARRPRADRAPEARLALSVQLPRAEAPSASSRTPPPTTPTAASWPRPRRGGA